MKRHPGVRLLPVVLALLAAWHSPARAQTVYEDIEKFLQSVDFDKPPCDSEKKAFLRDLQRHGIETLTDLRPYLSRSPHVKQNTLIALESLGGIDATTLGIVRRLALDAESSPDPYVTTAVRIVLGNVPEPDAVDFAVALASQVSFEPLEALLSWISSRSLETDHKSEENHTLAALCLRRLERLFETGTYAGKWLTRMSLVVERAPFDDPVYAEDLAHAFLNAVRNAGRLTDMRELALISAFTSLRQAAEHVPAIVDEGLVGIVTTGSDPLRKLVLWRLKAEGAESPFGWPRIIAAATRASPRLGPFLARLDGAEPAAAGEIQSLQSQIEQALESLQPPGATVAEVPRSDAAVVAVVAEPAPLKH